MTTEVIDEVKETSYLDMSDEDMLNVDPSTIEQPVEVALNDEGNTEQVVDTNESDESAVDNTDVQETEDSSNSNDNALDSDEEEESTSKESKPESDEEVDTFDYKAEYQKIVAPFKANGRDITVKGVDDAIALMQMGANYNKKMAALKPNLKLMKLLENNGLLNESKIGYLIDLEKKNPEAINKLLQDSGIDPLDMNAEKASEYKPKAYTVDDRELELDAVLDDLQESPTYNQTLDIVSNKWDGQSKQVIANSPQLLKVINGHVQTGIYDLISKEIESERTFGRLNGLSDIEAYRQVGDSIQARGGFNHLVQQPVATPSKPVVVQPKPKMGNEDRLREKKRAASSSTTSAAKTTAEFNPLMLSDDAFSKLVNEKFL